MAQFHRGRRTVRRGLLGTILLRFPVRRHHDFLPTKFFFEMATHATILRLLAFVTIC
ncbi:unnamed protein product [Protopolystoma xenopodis]|uniref:Uncharacterized protein n=1 Tax=Protopolystoma xenopodis TaxID=117903 RepID=A0A448XST6_9PLAT|nr:unnamed protein product [Protopolystoma xenopodis]